jgi:hypothetical protein
VLFPSKPTEICPQLTATVFATRRRGKSPSSPRVTGTKNSVPLWPLSVFDPTPIFTAMKQLKTILSEGEEMSDEYDFYADAERTGEISRVIYVRACLAAGLSKSKALESLRKNYQRAGLSHLF